MASIVAAVATHVADSANAVARSLAPVDTNGALSSTRVSASNSRSPPALRVADVLQKSAEDIKLLAVRGRPFRLADVVRIPFRV